MKVAPGARSALLAGCLLGFTEYANAQTLIEHSSEVRMQLDFVVPAAALAKFVPAGFDMNVATQGAAKDCNVRMIFIDRVDITKQDGSPAEPGSSQLVYLAVPVKQGQLLIHGLTSNPKDAPGPHGVYQLATTHKMSRATAANAAGPIMVDESWEFAAASGEHMSVTLKYERGTARKGGSEVKFYSAANPSFYQIFKIEQGLDIMRNATINVRDRVKEFSVKAGGGKIAPLFDGTEKVVSIDALHWYTRGVYQP